MNIDEFDAAFNKRMGDVGSTRLWTPEEVLAFANEAEREAAERANLIEDSTTAAVCAIAGLANVATYTLHAKILQVTSVTWDGRFLDGVSRDTLNRWYPNGWKTTTGRPSHFIAPQERTLTLYAKPTEAADIEIVVYRLPLTDMAVGSDEPEIHERHHFKLLDWMQRLAYQKDDTETLDPRAGERAEARFIANFGIKIDANTRRTQLERRSHQTRMNPHW